MDGCQLVYERWHDDNREHTTHVGDPWAGEMKGDIQFSRSPGAALFRNWSLCAVTVGCVVVSCDIRLLETFTVISRKVDSLCGGGGRFAALHA